MKTIDVGTEINFSEYTPGDHEGFVECINDFYKGGYPYLPYLEKDILAKNVSAGNMIVTVAKTADGRIVGTSAARKLEGTFEDSVLLLLRSVLSDYRQNGIGHVQEKYLFDLIFKKFHNFESLFADVMTHDAVSQTTLHNNGFVFCGFRMNLYKNEIICPHFDFAPGTKMTQAIYCKSFTSKNVRIYAPEKHRDFIGGIYDELKVPCEFSIVDPDSSKTVYSVEIDERHKCGEIYVVNSGVSHLEKLISDAKKLVKAGRTCVAYINMNQSGCPEIYEKLYEIGFVFSGIKPLSKTGEYLVMSNIENSVSKFEDIKYPIQMTDSVNYIFGGFENEKK